MVPALRPSQLQTYNEKQVKQLTRLIEVTRTDLGKADRQKVGHEAMGRNVCGVCCSAAAATAAAAELPLHVLHARQSPTHEPTCKPTYTPPGR